MRLTRVLLVEDDPSLGETLSTRLERERMSVCWVRTASDAAEQLRASDWDLTILDVCLPDGSGLDLAHLAKERSMAPVMLVTALDSAPHRLEGFEHGADDYLPKPFHLREFLLRVRHLLSTQAYAPALEAPLQVDDLRIDLAALTVRQVGGPPTYLSSRQVAVLRLLIGAAPDPVTRSAILDGVWGRNRYPSPRVVDNCIVGLRQALGPRGDGLIESIRGVGYLWTGPQQAL